MKTVIMSGGRGTRISDSFRIFRSRLSRSAANRSWSTKYVGFLRNIDDFELLPTVSEAIKQINKSGYLAIVVTNQPVIARGEVTFAELDEIHNKMETLLGKDGVYLDGIYFCPHHPDSGFEGEIPELKIQCDCRKPKSGMLKKAAEDFNIDLESSWMIGDGDLLKAVNEILEGTYDRES